MFISLYNKLLTLLKIIPFKGKKSYFLLENHRKQLFKRRRSDVRSIESRRKYINRE
jgi:hypothetical protein